MIPAVYTERGPVEIIQNHAATKWTCIFRFSIVAAPPNSPHSTSVSTLVFSRPSALLSLASALATVDGLHHLSSFQTFHRAQQLVKRLSEDDLELVSFQDGEKKVHRFTTVEVSGGRCVPPIL